MGSYQINEYIVAFLDSEKKFLGYDASIRNDELKISKTFVYIFKSEGLIKKSEIFKDFYYSTLLLNTILQTEVCYFYFYEIKTKDNVKISDPYLCNINNININPEPIVIYGVNPFKANLGIKELMLIK